MDNPTITKADLLPVTNEDEKRADDWATMIGRMGGVILDQSQRRGLATQFAAHRVAALGAIAEPERQPVTLAKDVLLVQAFADLEWLVKDNEANPAAIALATRHRHSASSGAAHSGEREALEKAIGWFEEYADNHTAKGTEDGRKKAATNQLRAAELRAALSPETREGVEKSTCAHCDAQVFLMGADYLDQLEQALNDVGAPRWSPDRMEKLNLVKRIAALSEARSNGAGEASKHYTLAMARRPKEICGVKVEPGLYRIHWKSGGSSLAAIGMCTNGAWWVAPTNWVEPAVALDIEENPEGRWSWAGVEALERIAPPTTEERLPGADEGQR